MILDSVILNEVKGHCICLSLASHNSPGAPFIAAISR